MSDPQTNGTGSYEGGIRVPAFMTWREVIPAGSVCNEPLHMIDLYPTLIKLAGGSIEQPLPLDGKNAWPTILGRSPSPHEDILHQREPGRGAIRVGDWKLVVRDGSVMRDLAGLGLEDADERGGAQFSVELFNLADDPYERSNGRAEAADRRGAAGPLGGLHGGGGPSQGWDASSAWLQASEGMG